MSDIVTNTRWRRLYQPEETLQEIVLLNAGFIPKLEEWHANNSMQNFWVLWYNFVPGCSCLSGGVSCELTPEKIILIPPNTLYSGIRKVSVPHFFIWFQTKAPFAFAKRRILELSAKPFLPLLARSIELNERTKVYHYNLVSSVLLSLPAETFSAADQQVKSKAIEKALEFIARYRGQVSNAQISEELHLSPIRFSHLFKEEMGISPQRYCLQVKMVASEQFLLQGRSVDLVAMECGFADRYHFSKEFKKYHGLPPAKWRKLYSK